MQQNQTRLGILLTNLGTPDTPTPRALRRYLKEFLSDRRVVDLPRLLWWPLLHGIILRTRPRRSAAAYRKVWTDEGAPLLVISRRQAEELQNALAARLGAVPVVLAMRYGEPSIQSGLEALRREGVTHLLVLPLYPQYSCSTTASTFDAVAEAFRGWRHLPVCRFVHDYHDHGGYIDAVAASIRESWAEQPPAERLIFSFHGTPQRFRDEGDPYYAQCRVTASRVAERLALAPERWMMTFQSRFGREEWLQPYTDASLKALAASGVETVDVVCPGFAADCLETLEEIAVENRRLFMDAGGKGLRYIPALNARADHIGALADILLRELRDGWT